MITIQCTQDDFCGAVVRFETLTDPVQPINVEPPYTCPLCGSDAEDVSDEWDATKEHEP